jgi:Zn ribbon nucleic-acid-binding protein
MALAIPDDFPTNLSEFEDRFPNERACRRFLVRMRWPDGFTCPKCHAKRGWRLRRRYLLECPECGHQTSVAAGTIFHGARKPLRTWFRAMFFWPSRASPRAQPS